MRGKTHTIQLLGGGFDVTGSINGSYLSERGLIRICIQHMHTTFFFFTLNVWSSVEKDELDNLQRFLTIGLGDGNKEMANM